jgi:hypothetical protein
MDMSAPDIAVTEKVVGSVGAYLSRGAGLVGVVVIILLNWNEGITTTSAIRYAILDEDGHATVKARRPVPA